MGGGGFELLYQKSEVVVVYVAAPIAVAVSVAVAAYLP